MAEVVAAYSRQGEHYTACISVNAEEQWTRSGVTFEEMIVELSGYLKQLPGCDLVFRRLDGPHLRDYTASEEERNQICNFPYIYAASNHDVTVVVRERPVAEDRVKVHIRAGYDTLADAFGDNVYVRQRDDGRVECPCCGRWHASIKDETLVCECIGYITAATLCGSWVELQTFDLVYAIPRASRYYLPRAWNSSGSWITREALSAKFAIFIKESSNGT